MLIAITGPGGSGKSTTIEHLKSVGYQSIERKTSRSIIADWGVSISEINSDPALTQKFQMEILKRKIDDEVIAAASDDVWITERTAADLFTYAIYSMGRLDSCSEFIDQYYQLCKQAMTNYVGVVYLRGGNFPIVADGTRSSNQWYTQMTDQSMLALTKEWANDRVITISGLEGRWRYPLITGNIGKWASDELHRRRSTNTQQ